MNGTNFLLGVNFVIAMSFCLAFFVVSTRSRSKIAARWIAAGFAVASLSALCELAVAHTDWVKAFAIGAFCAVLGGLQLLQVGVARLYSHRINPHRQILFFLGWTIVDLIIYDLPRGSVGHSVLYQAPFGLIALMAARSVFQQRSRAGIDQALALLLAFTGLHFFAKALVAVTVGAGGTAKDYIQTNYAIISQSSTAIMIVAVGLMLLSVLVLDIMTDERSNSETDMLSSLLNRRGFEKRTLQIIRRFPKEPHAVIMCDLDHFKSINDTYGHYHGDRVIEAFGQLLTAAAPADAVVGRMGGEEFALFLPHVTVGAAVGVANELRRRISALVVAGLPQEFRTTASFGVAPWDPELSLAQNLQRADMALYQAKKSGRNCVRTVGPEATTLSVAAR
ncbi:GGDEF domain-containing protein [Pseudorhizobium marinum]|uniref:GGDEF domain-containing protein n=1 Tax=Pseudorhizobium marinum TaxID=1496690 RepID=UPI000495F591|nr:GGDEF domain-containing protein [Pseudorhizobium marinum]